MDNENKRLVLRYAQLTIKHEVAGLEPQEAAECEKIAHTLLRECELDHDAILQRAAESLIEKLDC